MRARPSRLVYSADSLDMANFAHIQDVGAFSTALARSSLIPGRLVLIVEDRKDTRFLRRTLLQRHGVRVASPVVRYEFEQT